MPSAPGSNPTGVVIGISLAPPSAGSKPVGLVNPGVAPVGLVSAGLVSAGLAPTPGVGARVVPGAASDPGRVGVRPGLVRAGSVRPGLVNPGLVNPGLVRPGPVRPVLASPLPVRLGTGGMLIPNWDNPCDSADISSPGRSVNTAACLNSWCSGRSVVSVDS
ncbi:GLTT repeat (6 copies) [Mycobacterium tuberculosis]|uniref:GLTT repeat (6 copies) n=1 Tax=Mycobacterium tuberculosis TaxID=1773 RepID=A0A0T9DZI7_MYCTX|nr:GLTT repeat (6 copies) [Mycobacterium tuberculosis]CFA17775.1 GLTT repeat (6 copies) [Mycobacterium tuberculosis]CFA93618.1 GLTT repeat (6 copies) [Mycobacterium tuberculosis]CFB04929.1 GLTT repeat (6 copies) [Mycobacterium tuberculosis]CFB86712.1 GLTT repeat (6 copies) [Mycobacterium tuberculosis]